MNRRNSFVPPSETRSEPTVAASTFKIDAASTDVEIVKNDAASTDVEIVKNDTASTDVEIVKNDEASTRFEAEFIFPSVFLRGGARRASKRKIRDVASLAVLLDAPKRFFANLCEIVRKFGRR